MGRFRRIAVTGVVLAQSQNLIIPRYWLRSTPRRQQPLWSQNTLPCLQLLVELVPSKVKGVLGDGGQREGANGEESW
jgi:hypothetical protein